MQLGCAFYEFRGLLEAVQFWGWGGGAQHIETSHKDTSNLILIAHWPPVQQNVCSVADEIHCLN